MADPRIDFYILEAGVDRRQFTCQLIDQAYRRQHKLFIHCESEQQAFELDDLLWTYKTSSFVPHNLQGEGPTPPPPVQIGFSNNAGNFRDILINLSLSLPSFHRQFNRVIEIVDQSAEVKEALREHYRYYQSQSYQINNHKIAAPVQS
jgi:DNA polymerase-3 subunit chi